MNFAAVSGYVKPAVAGCIVAFIASTLMITGACGEINNDEYWKTAAVLSIFGIAIPHALLLLGFRLEQKMRWTQISSTVSIFGLAAIKSSK